MILIGLTVYSVNPIFFPKLFSEIKNNIHENLSEYNKYDNIVTDIMRLKKITLKDLDYNYYKLSLQNKSELKF